MLENSGLVGYAQEVLKETDQSCFVQTAKQLHVRYMAIFTKRSLLETSAVILFVSKGVDE